MSTSLHLLLRLINTVYDSVEFSDYFGHNIETRTIAEYLVIEHFAPGLISIDEEEPLLEALSQRQFRQIMTRAFVALLEEN